MTGGEGPGTPISENAGPNCDRTGIWLTFVARTFSLILRLQPKQRAKCGSTVLTRPRCYLAFRLRGPSGAPASLAGAVGGGGKVGLYDVENREARAMLAAVGGIQSFFKTLTGSTAAA